MEIRTSLDIDASADEVWNVLADFASYDAWNPMCRRMRGSCAVGARISFRVKLGPLALPVDAEVIEVDPGHGLRWVGPAARLPRTAIAGEHFFELTALGPDRCRLEHGEIFTGLAAPARAPRIEKLLVPQYAALNRALAAEVQLRSPARAAARSRVS